MNTVVLKPTKGHLLVSTPQLNDYYFGRSVIFLTEHNKEGSVGFIVNKPLKTTISEAIKDFPEYRARLFLGGPVEPNSLFFLHTLGDIIPDSIEVIDGLFWGGDFEIIKMMIKNNQLKNSEIKFFAGYSGWAPKQLERELMEHSWVVTKSDVKKIMRSNTDTFWKEKIKDSPIPEHLVWADFPINPSLN
jgi:putative transcriptional regulator